MAEGYDRQELCVNQQAGKVYEHIEDLRVSTDGLHAAYVASSECQSGDHEERCRRTVVLDQAGTAGTGYPDAFSVIAGRTALCVYRERLLHDAIWGRPLFRSFAPRGGRIAGQSAAVWYTPD